jgi:ABC-type phosphate transport system substrate-binding protein
LIRGAGGEVGLPAYSQWGTGYKYVSDQLVYTYTVYFNATEAIAAYDRGELDFLGVDQPLDLSSDYVQLPLMAGGIALAYHHSSLAPDSPPLNFTREALARIWYGRRGQVFPGPAPRGRSG